MVGKHESDKPIRFWFWLVVICLAVAILALYVGGVNVLEWVLDLAGIEQD